MFIYRQCLTVFVEQRIVDGSVCSAHYWSKTGAVVSEIDAKLLTGGDWGECRVSGEHLGQTYVSSRCNKVIRAAA
ncbi:MAG: hypothetical protein WAX63_11925 [Rhodoferax sp.]